MSVNAEEVQTQTGEISIQAKIEADASDVEQKEAELESNPVEVPVEVTMGEVETPEGGTITYETNTVTNETVNTTAETGDAEGAIESVKASAEETATMPIDGDADSARSEGDAAKSYVDGLTGTITIAGNDTATSTADAAVSDINTKTAEIQVTANTDTLVSSVSSALANGDFSVNVTANITGTVTSISTTSSSSDTTITHKTTGAQEYTGTILSAAHAMGTVDDDDVITGYNAHANGDVTIPHDEDSLVNELGTESMIRNGIWRIIPGGMHVEHLKKGDKYLSPRMATYVKKTI